MSPADSRPRHLPIAVGLVILLIVYGSLYPFQWNFTAPRPFVWGGRIGLRDLVENLLLFIPLGGLLGWAAGARPDRWAAFAGWCSLALVLAGTLQWLQKFLPRTPALSDVLFNMAGHALGWAGGLAVRRRTDTLSAQHRRWGDVDRYAVVLVALWTVAELYPLIPTLDLSSVAKNVRSLWRQELWQPRRMLLHAGMAFIGLSAVAQLARSVCQAQRARALSLAVALVVLAGKFAVVDQAPGVAVVAGIAGGWALWRCVDQWAQGSRWSATAWVALATYLLDALWPWAWRSPPGDMGWLPFASALSTNVQLSLTARALECLCFGALLWGTARNGARLGGMTLCTAMLAFACEWTQRYLPTRTAETTSVVLALGMGWLLFACTERQTAAPWQRALSHE